MVNLLHQNFSKNLTFTISIHVTDVKSYFFASRTANKIQPQKVYKQVILIRIETKTKNITMAKDLLELILAS